MTKDELYPVIDEVLSERMFPHMNAGSYWIEQSDGDVQLRIHPLTEALCDALCKAVGDLTAERDASRLIISDLTAEVERQRATILLLGLADIERLAADNERLRAALALAIGELSTYGPMRYTSPDQLLEHFMQEARRG